MTTPPTWPHTPTIRPKDRKQRIESAATQAFALRGYHQVSMSDVAASVGISAPALYRHFANKYDLFKHTAFGIVDAVEGATDDVTETTVAAGAPAEERAAALIHATLDSLIKCRGTGEIIRWESRYLEPADRASVDQRLAKVYGRFSSVLKELRPGLSSEDRALQSRAAFAVLASVSMHRTSISAATSEYLRTASQRALEADLPETEAYVAPAATGIPSTAKREQIVAHSIDLFFARGYNLVSIEEIGGAVGITASGVYRHFESKSGILAAACSRAAEYLGQVTRDVFAAVDSNDAALDGLIDAYVEAQLAHHKLLQVYIAESTNLSDEERERLLALQRDHIEEWAGLLRAVKPQFSASEARCIAHAGFHVVDSLGRVLAWQDTPSNRARVAHMLRAVLGV
ncbi:MULTISPECIES: TetR/AcrR family transcriptional regulator [unclassified Pseudoclavibacter]|uniref:TetR/AcrR family transcriptional regulator n=1 Tax=unclassified Pseudoclavibacter TaxID=2615177 RepID=UPI001BAB0744|nr:TetR/AcrR family transcriptional regulator [Pseudoclavibacter sp. Marseille-Q4354]MBS3177395.1 TetR/AcrR family transcriptional regulator [Pseudoclavibacter sp. Marseille-Q4354]